MNLKLNGIRKATKGRERPFAGISAASFKKAEDALAAIFISLLTNTNLDRFLSKKTTHYHFCSGLFTGASVFYLQAYLHLSKYSPVSFDILSLVK